MVKLFIFQSQLCFGLTNLKPKHAKDDELWHQATVLYHSFDANQVNIFSKGFIILNSYHSFDANQVKIVLNSFIISNIKFNRIFQTNELWRV